MDKSNIRDNILCISEDGLLLDIIEIEVFRYFVYIRFKNGNIWKFAREVIK